MQVPLAATQDPATALRHVSQCASKPGVYALLDFHPFLGDPLDVRLLKEIAVDDRVPRTLVLMSHAPRCHHEAAARVVDVPKGRTGLARGLLSDRTAALSRCRRETAAAGLIRNRRPSVWLDHLDPQRAGPSRKFEQSVIACHQPTRSGIHRQVDELLVVRVGAAQTARLAAGRWLRRELCPTVPGTKHGLSLAIPLRHW